MSYNDILDIVDNIIVENEFTTPESIEMDFNIKENIRIYEQKEEDIVIQQFVTLSIDKEELIKDKRINKLLKKDQKEISEKLEPNENRSLLICVKYEENDECEKVNQCISQIEGNSNFFNKFVLLYNENELNEVNKLLEADKSSIYKFINDKFKDYKVNRKNYITDFVEKLYDKMPFALIKVDILDMIDNMLTENRFQRLKNIEEQSYINKKCGRLYNQQGEDSVTQYLVVLNINETDLLNTRAFLEKDQIDVYQALKNYISNSSFDKNISLLLCIEYNQINRFEEINEYIMKVEEDPYYFKKFVLFYSKNEVININKELNNTEHCIWEFVKEKFECDEVINIEDKNIEFILKLCIKMPYIPITFSDSHKFNNISQKVEEEIQNKKLEHIWENIENYELGSLNDSLSINNENLDAILESWHCERGE